MLEITSHRQGALLNHNNGRESSDGLTVLIEGWSDSMHPVTVNGVKARRNGRAFAAEVTLTQKINTVTAASHTEYGDFSQSIVLVWDKQSFRRFNFFIDDNVFFLTDIAKERPKRLFDHFYLAGLKKIHDEYGTKFTLNCFYQNCHHPFEIKDFPDVYKQEFVDSSDWLRLSFHAKGEFPDRPYQDASYDEVARDYDQVKSEIVRFAGEQSFIPPVVIHWAMLRPAGIRAMADRGVRMLMGAFSHYAPVGPSAADRAAGSKTGQIATVQKSSSDSGQTDMPVCDIGFFRNLDEAMYISDHNQYYDPDFGIFFGRSGNTCNLCPIDVLKARYAKMFEDAETSGNETFGALSHEQYTFPYYGNYLPDHFERMACASKLLVDYGCKPVYFAEGLFGNTSWGK